MKLRIQPSRIKGIFAVPGSKSHTIRGLMAALAADGTSRLVAPLYSADTLAVRKAAETLGMKVQEDGRDWLCTGTGGVYHAPQGTLLDLANSGTGLRFFTSMAAAGNLQLTSGEVALGLFFSASVKDIHQCGEQAGGIMCAQQIHQTEDAQCEEKQVDSMLNMMRVPCRPFADQIRRRGQKQTCTAQCDQYADERK